jgi:hypothetical protein
MSRNACCPNIADNEDIDAKRLSGFFAARLSVVDAEV